MIDELRLGVTACATVLLVAVAAMRTAPARVRLGAALAAALATVADLWLVYGEPGEDLAAAQAVAVAAGLVLAGVILVVLAR